MKNLNSDGAKVLIQNKHPLWIRWAHWLNFPLLTIMIWSGILIYWANTAYTPFIPDSFYHFIGIDRKLALGMGIHFLFMWAFAINGLLYVIYLMASGEWREMFPRVSTFKEAQLVFLHDLGIYKGPLPPGKFNAAQRIAYTAVIAMGALSTLTGLAIYRPVQLGFLRALFAGYSTARLIHFLLAMAFIGFFMIHIAQVIRAGWNNFRSMVTGVEVVDKKSLDTKKPEAS
jgi:thiosulfate reductase cytochrome b subunit